MTTEQVIELVVAERERQIAKWGKQNLKLYFWILILQEELGEVAKAIIDEEPKENLLNEAVQVTAVAVQMCEWASELVGWPCNSREVLKLVFTGWKLSDGLPMNAHLEITTQIGMLCAEKKDNIFQEAEFASNYLKRIVFNGCLLIYRLSKQQQHEL
ncbi:MULTISPECIES: hypothetical protein [unclassified Spirosoma]|uniref:hypothetical protein n=1 Tax=unclassified Spirosoma TaxID=2621999 RepID=UPI00095B45EB|nr:MULTISPECIES: hypothetical protein [unclassified Spirosoma]MBN8824415.1 hypothetical protein [Spirosoma sp.]OJW70121.1 MAG: hypothetical protein BGO59_25955 [Spirosoma sp. 48-14]